MCRSTPRTPQVLAVAVGPCLLGIFVTEKGIKNPPCEQKRERWHR